MLFDARNQVRSRRCRLTPVIHAIGAVGVLACENDLGSLQTASWSVRDSAGITLVSNKSDSVSRGCVTVVPLPKTTIRSGAQRGNSIPPLYKVRGGAVLGDGRIVVLNAGNEELLFLAADGTYQYAVGGSGRGPGEFLDPTWLGRGGNDTLFVWDSGLMRLSMFNGRGELLTSHQVQAGDEKNAPAVIRGRFDDGSFFTGPGPLFFYGGETGVVRFPQTYGRYDLHTGHSEHVVTVRGWESFIGDGVSYDLPFGKREVAVAHGDFVVIGDNGTSSLRYYDLTGQLRRVVEWVSNPVPVTASDRRAFHQHAAKVLPAFAQPPADARFAKERPRFSSIQSDATGWIWVRSFAAGWESRGNWLVFDEEGFLRCAVESPADFSVLEIGEGHILGRQRDELGEEALVLYVLVRHLH